MNEITDSFLVEMRLRGFCVIDEVIPLSRCDSIRLSVQNTVEREGHNYASSPYVGFVPGAINHDQSIAPYLVDSRLAELVSLLLGDNVKVSFTSASINYPDAKRGKWHADWPFDQSIAGHISVPYPDAVMHLTTIWMLSPFDEVNGTLVIPGSHRCTTNPTEGRAIVDPEKAFETVMTITGSAGSVLVMDSRLWHSRPSNESTKPRLAFAVGYAPWWLNTEILRPGSEERRRIVGDSGRRESEVPPISLEVFALLPVDVRPLFQHWLEK